MVRARAQWWCLLLAALAGVYAEAQSDSAASHRAEIRSVAVIPGDNGPVLEITSTRPVTPQLQTVEDPLRLVHSFTSWVRFKRPLGRNNRKAISRVKTMASR